ncbi:MAG: hydroxyphenylacetyl-CoA thioesterase PaaI, partial [Hyphomonadaceae bacterium]
MNEADKLARQVADALLKREGTGPAWGVIIDDAREGYARIRMKLRDDMLNGHRIGHGGMIFALADTAFAYACNSRNENTVAQNASISFLAQAQPGEDLIAEAREVSRSGRSGVYQVSVRTGEGRVIAEFTGLSRTIGG